MACSEDPNQNMAKAEWRVREAAGTARRSCAFRNCSARSTFAWRKGGTLRSRRGGCQAPARSRFRALARDLAIVVIGSFSSAGRRACITIPPWCWTPMARWPGPIRKMHIPEDPLYFEKYYFTPGDLGFRCFDTRYARVAPLVCWDQWYPEAARLAALKRSAGSFYPTAIGWHPSEKAAAGRAARRVADHPALPRHRQRRLCSGREPRGLRRPGRTRGSIFGGIVCVRTRSGRFWRRPRTIRKKP